MSLCVDVRSEKNLKQIRAFSRVDFLDTNAPRHFYRGVFVQKSNNFWTGGDLNQHIGSGDIIHIETVVCRHRVMINGDQEIEPLG